MRAWTATRATAVPVATLLVATLLAACGGSAGPTASTAAPTTAATAAPTATVTPPPTPAPTPTPPADVSKAFAAHLAKPDFRGGGPITGTISIGNLEGQVSGSMQLRGADSRMELSMEIPGIVSSSSSTITIGDVTYTATPGGPWIQGPTAAGSSGLGQAIMLGALTARDEGVVDRGGRQLHLLVPAGGGAISAADLGITDPSMAGAAGKLAFFARDDGSLAILSVSLEWAIPSGSTTLPAAMTIDFGFDERPSVVIVAPTDPWTRHTSERFGYAIAYPGDWGVLEATTNDEADLFGASATEFAAVFRQRQPAAAADDLEAYVRAFVQAERRSTGARPESEEAVTLLGGPARRLTYHQELEGEDVYVVYTLLVRGRNAWQVGLVGPTGYEDEVLALHEQQLLTFSLGG